MSSRIDGLRDLGNIFQLGFVTRNPQMSVDFWVNTMGVGPFFFTPHVDNSNIRSNGISANIDMSVYIAYWGDVQIEIIEQHCDTPSVYSQWQAGEHKGPHHICFLTDDLAEVRGSFAARDIACVHEGQFGASSFAYFAPGGECPYVEVLQADEPLRGQFAAMKSVASGWGGRDPIRSSGM